MSDESAAAFRRLFDLRFLLTLAVVAALVAPLGFAMTGRLGLAWVTPGGDSGCGCSSYYWVPFAEGRLHFQAALSVFGFDQPSLL